MPAEDDVARLHGPWRPRTPAEAADLLTAYPGPWWVAGGWAVEAFTNIRREHADLDLSIPRSDVALLQRQLAGRFDVWAAEKGTLRPLVEPVDKPLPVTCSNLWLRASGADPWEYDVLLMDVTASMWTYKRDARISRAFEDMLWTHDGVDYLRPEVQLLHKAPGLRPKDHDDFKACLPVLDHTARAWLARAVQVAHPGHPWLDQL